MARIVLLDSGPLGMITHPRRNPEIKVWLTSLVRTTDVRVPEIADCEVPRELIRANATKGSARLDALARTVGYLPLTTEVMRRAARFWADARRQGRPTADPHALDGDVILAAQAAVPRDAGDDAIIATANVGHLSMFVPAYEWREIS